MNKILVFCAVALFLLPTVNCVTVSVKTNVGDFTEHLGAGVDDTINGNTVITRDTLSHATWAKSSANSKTNKKGTLKFSSDKTAKDDTGNTALTHLGITNAVSYQYSQWISKPGDFAAAAEYLDVTGAQSVDASAKVYNTKRAGLDVGVSTTVSNGDLHGYNNMAIASTNLGYAFQSFDSATGTSVKCDSVAMNLPKKYSDAQDKDPKYTEASIRTTAVGTVTNYEDAVVKSSLGTSIEQNALLSGSFTSTSTAGALSKTRNSNYGTKYGLDMQANIASGSPSVKGTLTYWVNPSLINKPITAAIAASQDGDNIGLVAGTYNENVDVNKKITVRGDNVNGITATNSGGGNVYLNSRKVLLRADDFGTYFGDQDQKQAGWIWFVGLSKTKDFSATYAAMPYATDLATINLMSSLDPSKYEIATHGLHHEEYRGLDYDTQFDLISQATQMLTTYFVRPRTFVTPYNYGDANTVLAAKALGYHTVTQSSVESVPGMAQYVPDFTWETTWNDNDAAHNSAEDFENAFSSVPNQKYFTVVLHPDTFSEYMPDGHLPVPPYDGTKIKAADTKAFEDSIDYLKGQNVEFMTMEQAYQWENGNWFAR